MTFCRGLQEVIDTSDVQWGANTEEANVILGRDQPWTRTVVGVSICPKLGSMLNHGIGNANNKV